MLDARSNIPIRKGTVKKVIIKGVALVTAIAFFVTSLPIDRVWATQRKMGTVPERDCPHFSITLPSYLGTVKDSWSPDESRVTSHESRNVIIHIQDAHCNYYAQHKINDIISFLNKEYGINTVNLEGGRGDYNLSVFTDINDKNIREKVADYFVKEGMVNGAEFFAINNPEKVKLWGVEDTKLYIENLAIYRKSFKHKELTDKYLANLSYFLSALKIHIFSPELLELDKRYCQYCQYKEGNLEFRGYLTYLAQEARRNAIDTKTFPNIYLLQQSSSEEEKINFRDANAERGKLIDELQKALSIDELGELVVKTVDFKAERITQKDFYAYILKKAKSLRLNLEKYPELKKYIVYISMYDAMDKTKIMDEVNKLESEIKEALFANEKQRELDKLSRNFALTKNMFNISLTKDDYKYYLANKDAFETRDYASFINKEAPLCKIQAKLDENIGELDGFRENMARFYDCSLKRDEAFLENIKFQSNESRVTSHESRVAIIVTGGFHTENLAELFKQNNIAYVSIIPNFKNGDKYECPYFNLLAGKNNKILTALAKNGHALAWFTYFCGDSGAVLGTEAEAMAGWVKLREAIARNESEVSIQTANGELKYYIGEVPVGERAHAIDGVIIDGKQVYFVGVVGARLETTPSQLVTAEDVTSKGTVPIVTAAPTGLLARVRARLNAWWNMPSPAGRFMFRGLIIGGAAAAVILATLAVLGLLPAIPIAVGTGGAALGAVPFVAKPASEGSTEFESLIEEAKQNMRKVSQDNSNFDTARQLLENARNIATRDQDIKRINNLSRLLTDGEYLRKRGATLSTVFFDEGLPHEIMRVFREEKHGASGLALFLAERHKYMPEEFKYLCHLLRAHLVEREQQFKNGEELEAPAPSDVQLFLAEVAMDKKIDPSVGTIAELFLESVNKINVTETGANDRAWGGIRASFDKRTEELSGKIAEALGRNDVATLKELLNVKHAMTMSVRGQESFDFEQSFVVDALDRLLQEALKDKDVLKARRIVDLIIAASGNKPTIALISLRDAADNLGISFEELLAGRLKEQDFRRAGNEPWVFPDFAARVEALRASNAEIEKRVLLTATPARRSVSEGGATPTPEADIGAQVSDVKNLRRLLRIIRLLNKDSKIGEDATDRQIIEFAINELKKQRDPKTWKSLVEERSDGRGNICVIISNKAKGSLDLPPAIRRLGKAIEKWAISAEGGVRAINFKNTDGAWMIVGFENEIGNASLIDSTVSGFRVSARGPSWQAQKCAETLEHEQREIALRKKGMTWQEAHKQAIAEQFLGVGQDFPAARMSIQSFLDDVNEFRKLQRVETIREIIQLQRDYIRKHTQLNFLEKTIVTVIIVSACMLLQLTRMFAPAIDLMSPGKLKLHRDKDITDGIVNRLKKEGERRGVLVIARRPGDWLGWHPVNLLDFELWAFDKKAVQDYINKNKGRLEQAATTQQPDSFINLVLQRIDGRNFSPERNKVLDDFIAQFKINLLASKGIVKAGTAARPIMPDMPSGMPLRDQLFPVAAELRNAQIGAAVNMPPAGVAPAPNPNEVSGSGPSATVDNIAVKAGEIADTYPRDGFRVTPRSPISGKLYNIFKHPDEVVRLLLGRNWYLRNKTQGEAKRIIDDGLSNFKSTALTEMKKWIIAQLREEGYSINEEHIRAVVSYGSYWYSEEVPSDLDMFVVVSKEGIDEMLLGKKIDQAEWFENDARRKVDTVDLKVVSESYYRNRDYEVEEDIDSQMRDEVMFWGHGIIMDGTDYWANEPTPFNLIQAIRQMVYAVKWQLDNEYDRDRDYALRKTGRRWQEAKLMFDLLFSDYYLGKGTSEMGYARIRAIDRDMQKALTEANPGLIVSALQKALQELLTTHVEEGLKRDIPNEIERINKLYAGETYRVVYLPTSTAAAKAPAPAGPETRRGLAEGGPPVTMGGNFVQMAEGGRFEEAVVTLEAGWKDINEKEGTQYQDAWNELMGDIRLLEPAVRQALMDELKTKPDLHTAVTAALGGEASRGAAQPAPAPAAAHAFSVRLEGQINQEMIEKAINGLIERILASGFVEDTNGNRALLKQYLHELVGNAEKAKRSQLLIDRFGTLAGLGSEEITAADEETKGQTFIEIGCAEEIGALRVFVRNNTGLDKGLAERINEKLSMNMEEAVVKSAETDSQNNGVIGGGLGLVIARDIAQKLGGEMSRPRSENGWTTFEMEIRKAEPEPAEAGRRGPLPVTAEPSAAMPTVSVAPEIAEPLPALPGPGTPPAAESVTDKFRVVRNDERRDSTDLVSLPGSADVKHENGQTVVVREMETRLAKLGQLSGNELVVEHYKRRNRESLKNTISKNTKLLLEKLLSEEREKGRKAARHLVYLEKSDKDIEGTIRNIATGVVESEMKNIKPEEKGRLIDELADRTTFISLEDFPENKLLLDAYFVVAGQGLLNARRYEKRKDGQPGDYDGELSDAEAARLRNCLEFIFDLESLRSSGVDINNPREVIKALLLDGLSVRIAAIAICKEIEAYKKQNHEVITAL